MNTKRYRVERTYLVRQVQVYEIELPSDLNPHEWQEGDSVAFDEAVCESLLIEEDVELLDDDELTVTIMSEVVA